MYLHDFICPKCSNYYRRIWTSSWHGAMWCKRCGVECQHHETYLLPDHEGSGEPVPRYDQQIVVKLTTTTNYQAIDSSGTALHNKALSRGLPSQILTIDPGADQIDLRAKAALEALTADSRLYIVGHGQGDKLQGMIPMNLAYAVVFTWGVKAVNRITLVSCAVGSSKLVLLDETYAQSFHRSLLPRLRTVVAAYRVPISVAIAELAQKYGKPELEGKKTFFTDKDEIQWMALDGDQVKVVWYWEGQTQRSRNRSQDRANRS